MRTRREVIFGGALTILFGRRACSHAQTARAGGCSISGPEARRLLGSTDNTQFFVTGHEPVIRTSGNRNLDFALAQTLAMLAETFNVLPGFGYFDDYDGMNAYATAERILSRSDGTVLFGTRLLRSLLAQGQHPEAAVAMVAGHEFGHIVQYQRDLARTLQGWDATVRRIELHADFLAGYFAGIRKIQRPSFPAVVFATTAQQLGDYDGGSDHHGTPAERAAAIVRGFLTAFRERRAFAEAVSIGVSYVRSIP
jgi:hypothetical protein